MVFFFAFVLQFCARHALVQLAGMQPQLLEDLERALLENRGGATVLNHEMASHKELQKAHLGQELQSWSLSPSTDFKTISGQIARHALP